MKAFTEHDVENQLTNQQQPRHRATLWAALSGFQSNMPKQPSERFSRSLLTCGLGSPRSAGLQQPARGRGRTNRHGKSGKRIPNAGAWAAAGRESKRKFWVITARVSEQAVEGEKPGF